MSVRPFHLAFPVNDLAQAEDFYVNTLGCSIGRKSDHWIDFDFFGHQITAHLTADSNPIQTNAVDGNQVPVRHFGVILEWEDWEKLSQRLIELETEFLIEPRIRFQGKPGEQATMFFHDPTGNALEFKAFKSDKAIFDAS